MPKMICYVANSRVDGVLVYNEAASWEEVQEQCEEHRLVNPTYIGQYDYSYITKDSIEFGKRPIGPRRARKRGRGNLL